MPRSKQTEDLEKIFPIIKKHPQGIGISLLEETLVQEHETRLSRRTLQRRLEQLISDGRIISEGKKYGPGLPGSYDAGGTVIGQGAVCPHVSRRGPYPQGDPKAVDAPSARRI